MDSITNEHTTERDIPAQYHTEYYSDFPASAPLIQEENKENVQEKGDPRRFYILLVFSLLTFTQGGIWNTWGSISDSANFAFGWKDSTIFLMSNWGPITYILSTVFFAWLADVKGLRISCFVTGFLVAAGCGLRCISSTPPAATWLIHVGQILNGFGGPIAMGGPPLVSAVWFPVHERTKATAVGTVFNGLGVAVSFIIAPLLVPDVGDNATDTAMGISSNNYTVGYIRHRIMILMYIEFAWSMLIFIAICVYFPSRPKLAPSVTATVARLPFKKAIVSLCKNYRFWMLSLPYALSCGMYGVWGSVLDVNLKRRGIGQDVAAWVGFWMTIAAQACGLGVGTFADIFAKRMKVMIVTCYTIGSAVFLVFCLMYYKVIPLSIWLLYSTNIVTAAAIQSSPPLLYELICESTFPVAEGITNIFMTSLNNLFGLLFLLIPMFVTDTSWMNWLVLGAIVVCIPVFALFPESYKRFDIDTEGETTPNGTADTNIQQQREET